MFDTVIFDLDGTLLDTIGDLANSANHICEIHGWPVHTVDEYKLMVGNGIPKLVERFSPAGVDVAEITKEFSAYYDLHKADTTAPYEGIVNTVELLKRSGVRVSVLSNKAHHLAGPVVEGYFPGTFELVQGALPDVPTKPDPTLLHTMMEQMGVKAERTLFVGDSNVDILTGKNGGLTTCGVLWGFRCEEELRRAGADYLISHPGELLELVTGTGLIDDPVKGAELLAQGKLVAVPTETVYGLASDAANGQSVHNNYEAKGRPDTKPLSVLVSGMDMVEKVCKAIPLDSYKLAEAFWPGPLTMILASNGTLPDIVTAGGKTQGVRCPDHPATLEVIRALGRPLACPSANLSGHPSPKSAGDVFSQLAGSIDAVLDGGACFVGVESTILDMTAHPYRILRQGGLSRERIEMVLGEKVSV